MAGGASLTAGVGCDGRGREPHTVSPRYGLRSRAPSVDGMHVARIAAQR